MGFFFSGIGVNLTKKWEIKFGHGGIRKCTRSGKRRVCHKHCCTTLHIFVFDTGWFEDRVLVSVGPIVDVKFIANEWSKQEETFDVLRSV